MKKIDVILAVITGEVVAWFFLGILKTQKIDLPPYLDGILLFILAPLLTLFGLWIAYLIGKKFIFVFQFAKFGLVGILATVVDLGIFNRLILLTGISSGFYSSVFKGITFIVATCSKYFADKFWAFEKMEKTGMKKEFSQFFIVTLLGFIINVGLYSIVVNIVKPQFGIEPKMWANLAAVMAAIAVAGWNFIGYKFIVFKK